ncbi:MAG: alpha/beta fold hydrolase [Microbacteriaceae bacterium]
MTVVQLPTLSWGDPTESRRALLVHGLGSDAHTMWRIGEHLASEGWFAIAVDQRGHGTAPRTERYRIEDYADDLLHVPHDRPWDVVIGHSIGGASVVHAATVHPGWTRRLALIDPALVASEHDRAEIKTRQLNNNANLTITTQSAANPHWDVRDIETSVAAQRAADPDALAKSCDDNADWDVIDDAIALTVPTLVIQGDPTVMARYTDANADAVESVNPLVTHVTISGAGHNVHRDRPTEFCAELSKWLNR